MNKVSQTLKFPDGFLWGTATAAYQIEGDNVNSDWWDWEQKGKVKEKSGKACNSWELWREDIDLAKSLSNNAYRFSIEWSRIEPEEGKYDIEALRHYEEQIKYLHKLGMKALVTLWHFSLPRWFLKKEGFVKGKNSHFFLKYVDFILNNLSELPDVWLMMNEPNTYLARSYLNGDWPPGFTDRLRFIITVGNMAKINKATYNLIHSKINKAEVGNTYHFVCFEYFGKNPLIKVIQKFLNFVNNQLPIVFTRINIDFIGVNYYVVHLTTWHDLWPRKVLIKKDDEYNMFFGKKNDIGWHIYPQGIYKILVDLKKYNLPIYVTEMGIADKNDQMRKDFIFDNLEWVHAATKEGVSVRGFFYWSLLDNFEWVQGFEPKFGLFETDFKTFERRSRPSAKFYAEICKTNELKI